MRAISSRIATDPRNAKTARRLLDRLPLRSTVPCMRFLRLAASFALFLAATMTFATEESLSAVFDRVDVAPAQTSIYIGTVSMTMPTFVRENGTYAASYTAKVFPFFFYNESGRLEIDVSDDALRQLARGETITFVGRGVNTDGEHRHIEGRAVPTDAFSGQIKVRVFVTSRIELIFNTTYRFVGRP